MKTLLLLLACTCTALAAENVFHVSMKVPSREQRLRGARPSGGLPRSVTGTRAAQTPLPRYDGPKEPQPEYAGRVSANKNLTIINGSDAFRGQFPWMLAMMIDESYFCGATIISHDWVLTAGHCVDGASQFVITAGCLTPDGTEPTRQVVVATEAFRHPDYSANFVDNDIALIKPTTQFKFTSPVVNLVRLPSYTMAMDMMAGTIATISGWGKTSDDSQGGLAPTLQYVEMTINDGKACSNFYGNTYIPTKICFDTKKDDKSTCQGDSGGPLVIQEDDGLWTVIGLTSFGASDGCSLGLPVVFTRVASFLAFIEEITNIAPRD